MKEGRFPTLVPAQRREHARVVDAAMKEGRFPTLVGASGDNGRPH